MYLIFKIFNLLQNVRSYTMWKMPCGHFSKWVGNASKRLSLPFALFFLYILWCTTFKRWSFRHEGRSYLLQVNIVIIKYFFRGKLIFCIRPHYELLDLCESNDPMDMMYRGSESPGYYPNTPPQHHKGRPRKRKIPTEDSSPCGEMPVTMRMAAATLGNYFYIKYLSFLN